jgi:hypothetical protein
MPACAKCPRSCLMSCLVNSLPWCGWRRTKSTPLSTTRNRAPWVGSIAAPRWWSRDSISRQCMFALTGSWNIALSRLEWRLMAWLPLALVCYGRVSPKGGIPMAKRITRHAFIECHRATPMPNHPRGQFVCSTRPCRCRGFFCTGCFVWFCKKANCAFNNSTNALALPNFISSRGISFSSKSISEIIAILLNRNKNIYPF